ncbi:MAG: AraC family transcriptional regulator [Anaerolineae bacterium]
MHDILADFLRTLQLQSCIYCQSEIHKGDWALKFHALNGGMFHIVREGCCWLLCGEQKLRLEVGDLVILSQGTEHVIADRVNAPLCADIYPPQDSAEQCQRMRWGSDGLHMVLICGTFRFHGFRGASLLPVLPPIIHFRAEHIQQHGLTPIMTALIEEANSERQGKNVVLHRLADILFVQVTRACLADPATKTQGWLAGLGDPQIAAALAEIHGDPAQNWTVERLATQVAMSRSAFAARFTELVGISPIEYLTKWRMQLAIRMLDHRNLSIPEIAECVGYTSEIAFGRAFKRVFSISPSAYRRRATNRLADEHL